MNTVAIAKEYQTVTLAQLAESTYNPRRHFSDALLAELAQSIKTQGVLQPLLVRPLSKSTFEIVAGTRRFRACQLAKVDAVPVRVVALTDAQALEAAVVENLQRADVHPLEEAQGFAALLRLEEPRYTIEEIARKTGKTKTFITTRIKLIELIEAAQSAFLAGEIQLGHALLLARLNPELQTAAFERCFLPAYQSDEAAPTRRQCRPVAQLQEWIRDHVLLVLSDAPFDLSDKKLNPAAGSCLQCPKRTGHNRLLFADIATDACTDPSCYSIKITNHLLREIEKNPAIVRVSTEWSANGEATEDVLSRRQYTHIHTEKPEDDYQRKSPDFKKCKYAQAAIVTHGEDTGTLLQVCIAQNCPIHIEHRTSTRKEYVPPTREQQKATREKERFEQRIHETTAHRLLDAITKKVPATPAKRELAFIADTLISRLQWLHTDAVAVRLGLLDKKTKQSREQTAKKLHAYVAAISAAELPKLIFFLMLFENATAYSYKSNRMKAAADLYRVDIRAIEQAAKKEHTDKQKAKVDKAKAQALKTASKKPAA